MRQFVHRPDGQPAAPVKELALLVCRTFPQSGCVIQHPAMQKDILAAGDDLQWIELQVFHGAHRLRCTRESAPAPSGPQTLLAEDEATGCLHVDGQHDDS